MLMPAFDDPNFLYSYFLRSQVSFFLVLHLHLDGHILRAGYGKLELCCVAFDDKVLHNAQGVCYSCWQPTCVPPVSLCGRRTVAPATQHHTPPHTTPGPDQTTWLLNETWPHCFFLMMQSYHHGTETHNMVCLAFQLSNGKLIAWNPRITGTYSKEFFLGQINQLDVPDNFANLVPPKTFANIEPDHSLQIFTMDHF